ncbi:MAG: protein BatD [Lentisphaerae bacterium]|nr:protein BatD [Lentisphaerota bacterium]
MKLFFKIILCLTMATVQLNKASASDVQVNALVEGREFFLGETFIYQIKVSGSDNPEQPDVSAIRDFSVEYAGGRNTSSQSVTVINGNVKREVTREYVFSYRLSPLSDGDLTIPPLRVRVNQRDYIVPSVSIRVNRPQECDDF